MRHRDDGTGLHTTSTRNDLGTAKDLLASPLIPQQARPTHDGIELGAPAPALPVAMQPATSIPATAQWKTGHGPRAFAAATLLFAVGGASALGLRYAEHRGSEEFISLVVGIGVVVALWALLIASTPQVVSLRGSLLTVRNSSGSERFDLADGMQPVDVLGEPRSSQWALLLHRPDHTSVVLRRRDVDAATLDPIVRHYRALAEQRYAERQARFSR